MYITFGIHYCLNVVTGKKNWANGVLIRSLAIPNEHEKSAAGPGLLTKRYGLNRNHDNLEVSINNGLWISKGFTTKEFGKIIQTTRIGITKAKHLPWRWYIQNSRSISKRVKGDLTPSLNDSWRPSLRETL